jgi:hypothetical protein
MGWASEYIARLQNGETIQFRPRGNSMKGKVESGQLCTVEPVVPATLKVGDKIRRLDMALAPRMGFNRANGRLQTNPFDKHPSTTPNRSLGGNGRRAQANLPDLLSPTHQCDFVIGAFSAPVLSTDAGSRSAAWPHTASVSVSGGAAKLRGVDCC